MSDRADYRAEVEERLGRPFDRVKEQLEELFDRDWDDVIVVIETSVMKSERSYSDVIVDLVERSERQATPQARARRSLVRWIGKPWRERENPWDRFKDRVPAPPPSTDLEADDLEEWTPLRPDEEE